MVSAAEQRRAEAHRQALIDAWEQGRLAAYEGAEPTDNPYAEHGHADPRRCRVCGNGYVRCRRIDEKAPEADRHEWSPNVNRAGEVIE